MKRDTEEDKQLNKDIIDNVTVNADEVLDRLGEIRNVLKQDLADNQKFFNNEIHKEKFDREVAAIYIKTIHNLIDTINMLGKIKIRPDSAKSKTDNENN
jgi:hypothetical protein